MADKGFQAKTAMRRATAAAAGAVHLRPREHKFTCLDKKVLLPCLMALRFEPLNTTDQEASFENLTNRILAALKIIRFKFESMFQLALRDATFELETGLLELAQMDSKKGTASLVSAYERTRSAFMSVPNTGLKLIAAKLFIVCTLLREAVEGVSQRGVKKACMRMLFNAHCTAEIKRLCNAQFALLETSGADRGVPEQLAPVFKDLAELSVFVWELAPKDMNVEFPCVVRPNGRVVHPVWDLRGWGRTETLTGHERIVTCLAAVKELGLLFSGSWDTTVRVWDVQTVRCIAVLEGHEDSILCLATGGSRVYSGSADKNIRIWSCDKIAAKTDACVGFLSGHKGGVTALLVVKAKLFSASTEGNIFVWALSGTTKPSLVQQLQGHEGNITSLACCDQFLFSASWDTTVRVWSIDTLECTQVLHAHDKNVTALAVGTNNRLITASIDKSVRVWDYLKDYQESTYQCTRTIEGVEQSVYALACYGEYLFTAGPEGSISLWNLEMAACTRVLQGHTDAVYNLFLLGGRLCSSSADKTVRLW
mmetsp:Transcript_31240/g.71915  ORF Transcript_31240/g.71915 Transcript_31240/m.71915 type:complete len:538 (+) Transcript_31240:34-1647(+)